MKRVLLRAPIFTQSGYGVHARQIGRWLVRRKGVSLSVQPLSWGATPWILKGPEPVDDELRERIVDPRDCAPFDLSVQLQLPDEWDPTLSARTVGVTAAVETTAAPAAWAAACSRVSLVVVPSKHAAASLAAAGASGAIVVPESFPTVEPALVDLPLEPTSFGVLVVGQVTSPDEKLDRKNIVATVRWACEALAGDPSAAVVVKANAGRATALDALSVSTLVGRATEGIERCPPVHFVSGYVSDAAMAGIYAHPGIKCIASATRGEGFGLPLLEAAARAVPVVATDWSAHAEYLSCEKWSRVDCDVVPIPRERADGRIFAAGARWAEPRAASFKAQLKRLRESYTVPKSWALARAAKLAQTHSQQAVEAAWEKALACEL